MTFLAALLVPPMAAAQPGLEQRLRAHVQALAGTVGERSVLEPEALERAAAYVEGALREAGYEPRSEPYEAGGRRLRNLVAERPGAGPWVVVGAHYDSAPGTPGADDNASGVAALIELARLAREFPPGRPLRFAAFSSEEPPSFGTPDMGSWRHAAAAKERGERIAAMLCLEMLGRYDERPGSQSYPLFLGFFYPDAADFIAVVSDFRSRGLMREVAAALREAGVKAETGALPSWIAGVDFSDHRSFWKHGYPAVMLTDTAFYRDARYHRADDLPETLDYRRMAELTRGLRLALERLAAGEAR